MKEKKSYEKALFKAHTFQNRDRRRERNDKENCVSVPFLCDKNIWNCK